MYTIYINDRPLRLCSPAELDRIDTSAEEHLLARYSGKAKTLLHYVDTLEKGSQRVLAVTLYHPNVEQLWLDFHEHYKVLEAAGGLVFNPQGKLLLLFRRGHWDLPKGKIDKGEGREEAAVREVQEETGLSQLQRGPLLTTTFHTYRDDKDRRILKPTYWYRMETAEQELTPETEEGIERAEWVDPATYLADPQPTYSNILELIENFSS